MIFAKLAVVLLGLVSAAGPAAAASAFEQIKFTAGEVLFQAECRRCHAIEPTHPTYGPPLTNIFRRAAGTHEGYDYSEALASSGIVWTEGALRAWMEDNDGFMPGTKMRHIGIEDRTIQDLILAYLKRISF